MTTRVALVSCGKLKRDVPSPARSLYLGALVEKSLAHAERTHDHTFILSAMHGVIPLDQVVVPYNLKLTDVPKLHRSRWGIYVANQLADAFSFAPLQISIYASAEYTRHVVEAGKRMPWTFIPPFPGWEGMPIGRRLQALGNALNDLDGRGALPDVTTHETNQAEEDE